MYIFVCAKCRGFQSVQEANTFGSMCESCWAESQPRTMRYRCVSIRDRARPGKPGSDGRVTIRYILPE